MHIIFDLDGTIIDSKPEILNTFKLVFDEVKPDSSINYEKINFGATLNDVLEKIYGENLAKIEKAKLRFASIYDRSEYEETHLYTGVKITLDHLKASGHLLYIATNKRLIPTLRILKKKAIDWYFSDIITSDVDHGLTLPKNKLINRLMSKHSFSHGFMVGDTHTDISAGKDQNLDTIAVTYGYENRDTFAPHKPTYIIDSFEEIITIV